MKGNQSMYVLGAIVVVVIAAIFFTVHRSKNADPAVVDTPAVVAPAPTTEPATPPAPAASEPAPSAEQK